MEEILYRGKICGKTCITSIPFLCHPASTMVCLATQKLSEHPLGIFCVVFITQGYLIINSISVLHPLLREQDIGAENSKLFIMLAFFASHPETLQELLQYSKRYSSVPGNSKRFRNFVFINITVLITRVLGTLFQDPGPKAKILEQILLAKLYLLGYYKGFRSCD